jgi:hypothetical protein
LKERLEYHLTDFDDLPPLEPDAAVCAAVPENPLLTLDPKTNPAAEYFDV